MDKDKQQGEYEPPTNGLSYNKLFNEETSGKEESSTLVDTLIQAKEFPKD